MILLRGLFFPDPLYKTVRGDERGSVTSNMLRRTVAVVMALVAVTPLVEGQVPDREGRAGREKRCRRLQNGPTGFVSEICLIITGYLSDYQLLSGVKSCWALEGKYENFNFAFQFWACSTWSSSRTAPATRPRTAAPEYASRARSARPRAVGQAGCAPPGSGSAAFVR